MRSRQERLKPSGQALLSRSRDRKGAPGWGRRFRLPIVHSAFGRGCAALRGGIANPRVARGAPQKTISRYFPLSAEAGSCRWNMYEISTGMSSIDLTRNTIW
jgi:hypothetical protein